PARARQAARQAASAEAVAMGAGTEIGRLTLIRNVRAVTDVVSSRSRGFVRSYEVISEELVAAVPPRVEVRIRAEVVKSAQSPSEEIDGLKLFLDVIGSPKLLILLPERTTSDVPPASSNESTQVALQAPDTTVSVKTTRGSSSHDASSVPPESDGTIRAAEPAAPAACPGSP